MKKGLTRILVTSICLVAALAVLSLAACSTAATTTPPAATTSAIAATTTASKPVTTAAVTTTVAANRFLKVGMIVPVTGPAAEKGRPGNDALQDAIEYVNKELGGAGGIPLQVSLYDSGYDATKVVTAVNGFMSDGDLMFTTMSSYEMTAALGIANRAGFPGMATFTSPNLYRPPQHIYGQTPDYGDDFSAFANYYMKNIWKGSGKPTFAIEALNNSTGQGAKDAARALADSLGINVPSNLVFDHTASTIDETTNLKIIQNAKPDVLFISSTPQPTSVIMKNAKTLGMIPGMTIGLAHASFTKALIDLAGADIMEGAYGVYPTVSWDDNVPGIAKATEYVKKNHASDYGNMDYLANWTTMLVTVQILKLAVQNAGYDALAKGDASSWSALEKSGIQKLDNYDVQGLHGPVTYTAGDNRLDKAVKVIQVKSGKITAITDWINTPAIKYEDLSWWGK